MKVKPLDPVNIALNGYTLIEASAGTGKTYTITSLYLRFILERGLRIRDILVVTYTRAAAEELRQKIRERVRTGLLMLTGRATGEDDGFVNELAERLESSGKVRRHAMVQRLEEAMLCLDEAAVYTIHSFCQRMLREFAFESSAPIRAEILPSQEDLIRDGCAEFVRRKFYSSDRNFMECVDSVFSLEDLPEEIYSSLKSVINLPYPEIIHSCTLDEVRQEIRIFSEKTRKVAANAFGGQGDLKKKVTAVGRAAVSNLAGFLKDDAGLPDRVISKLETELLKELKGLLKQEDRVLMEFDDNAVGAALGLTELVLYNLFALASWRFVRVLLARLLYSGNVRKSAGLKKLLEPYLLHFETAVERWFDQKGLCGPPEGLEDLLREPAMELLGEILVVHGDMGARLQSAVLCEAREFVMDYVAEYRKKYSIMTYDDMLLMLKEALSTGSQKNVLAGRIRKRFPVALIDEFQDTDSIQWEIFSAIYPDPARSGLFLIGDPKQAIYSFRGADIFTYLQARALVSEDRRLGLDTNWRSSPALVGFVNTMFRRREQNAFLLEGIDYNLVKPRQDFDESLVIEGAGQCSPAEVWLFFDDREDGPGRSEHRADIEKCGPARIAAMEIRKLLTAGQKGMGCFLNRGGRREPVLAGDIAVLVRDFVEASKIRDALYALGIPSVYYGPGSVFKSDDARDMLYMLGAAADPSDVSAVCTGLGTVSLGFSAHDIYRLRQDQDAWEAVADRFSELRKIWLEQGVFPMILTMFSWFGVPERLLSLTDGERRLTNLRQISELLSRAERDHPGPERLILWLNENISHPDDRADEQKLRLETDENLVKVMSYHRSKGLEFPILFLPFIDTLGLNEKADRIPRLYSLERNGYICPVAERMPAPEEAEAALAELRNRVTGLAAGEAGRSSRPMDWEYELNRQKQAELVRLVYVAFTRARHRVYFGFSSEHSLYASAMGNMLLGHVDAEKGATVSARELLENELGGPDKVAVFYCDEKLSSLAEGQPSGMDISRQVPGKMLLRTTRPVPFAPRTWIQSSFSSLARERVGHVPLDWSPEPEMKDRQDIFSFPRGSVAGNCVHRLFEIIDFRGTEEDFIEPARTVLRDFGLDEVWDTVLARMAASVIETDIGRGVILGQLDPRWMSREMGFAWPFSREETEHFPGLSEYCEKGVLKGFIDLIFRHGDMFYIVDYKTNWLGAGIEEYGLENLDRAMDAHGYWLQSGIYAAALDRFLRVGLKGHGFPRQFGGVFYLFVRGINPEHGPEFGVRYISPHELVEKFPRFFTVE